MFDSDIGLSPGRLQAIVWTNAGMLSIGPLGTHVRANAFENVVCEIATISSRPQCVNSRCRNWQFWPSCPLRKGDPLAQWQCFHAPFGSRMSQKYQITFHRKQLAFYVAYSDKTINLNLFLHHEPNGSTKGKLSNRNQETNICLYLYPGTCTQVHVWLNVLLFIPLLYYMLHFCCFFFFSM